MPQDRRTMAPPLNCVWDARVIPFARFVWCMNIILLSTTDEPLADGFCYRTGQFRITIRAANLASRAALRFPSHADTIEPFISICQI